MLFFVEHYIQSAADKCVTKFILIFFLWCFVQWLDKTDGLSFNKQQVKFDYIKFVESYVQACIIQLTCFEVYQWIFITSQQHHVFDIRLIKEFRSMLVLLSILLILVLNIIELLIIHYCIHVLHFTRCGFAVASQLVALT